MHEQSPGWQAVKDRALAYWTDSSNYVASQPNQKRPRNSRGLIFIWKRVTSLYILAAFEMIGR